MRVNDHKNERSKKAETTIFYQHNNREIYISTITNTYIYIHIYIYTRIVYIYIHTIIENNKEK